MPENQGQYLRNYKKKNGRIYQVHNTAHWYVLHKGTELLTTLLPTKCLEALLVIPVDNSGLETRQRS